MKLLIFCPYYPPHIGGLESHADEFNKYLSQKGMDITVFTPHLPESSPEKEIKYNGVKIIRFPAFEIINNYPLPKFWRPRFWQLFLGLFKEKFDIVVSRTRFFNTSLLTLVYAKIKKVYPHTKNLLLRNRNNSIDNFGVGARWIHIEHGSDFVKLTNKFYSAAAKLYDCTFGKIILKFCDKLVANSKASADFCRKLAPKKHCAVIYRGVEIEKIKNTAPDLQLKNKYKDKFIISFIGRLISGKGVSDLISALENISYDFVLFVIGGGPERKNLEALAKKLNLQNKIIFFGYQKFEDAISIIKISDAVVNPSYTEGLPTSVIEAALCRKAIVATNVGGTPEIITDNKNGFLIEPKNIGLLKEKLEVLANDKLLREKFGASARDQAVNKFNWEKSTEEYLKIFNEMEKYAQGGQ